MRAVDMTSTQVRAGRKKHQRENVGHAGIRPLNDQGGPLLTSACTPDHILMQSLRVNLVMTCSARRYPILALVTSLMYLFLAFPWDG